MLTAFSSEINLYVPRKDVIYAFSLWRTECFYTAESSFFIFKFNFFVTYEHLSEWCSVMVSTPVSYLEFMCLNLDFESVLGCFTIFSSPLKYWNCASQWTRRVFSVPFSESKLHDLWSCVIFCLFWQ